MSVASYGEAWTDGVHRWCRLSGTTEECLDCGCVAYHQTLDGTPRFDGGVIRYARWIGGRWVGWTTRDAKQPPSECRGAEKSLRSNTNEVRAR